MRKEVSRLQFCRQSAGQPSQPRVPPDGLLTVDCRLCNAYSQAERKKVDDTTYLFCIKSWGFRVGNGSFGQLGRLPPFKERTIIVYAE